MDAEAAGGIALAVTQNRFSTGERSAAVHRPRGFPKQG